MSDLAGRTILVVENNAHMRCMLCAVLDAFGTGRIVEAEDALSGYLAMACEPVDLVLLDFFLGERDGTAFLELLRRDAACPNRTTPVVIVTALPHHPRVRTALDAGASAIIGKPAAPQLLYETISVLIGRPAQPVARAGVNGPGSRLPSAPGSMLA